jgi:O-antigen/teichoic acid export membrane protein
MLLVAAVVVVFGIGSVFVLPWRSILGARAMSPTDLRLSLVTFVLIGASSIVATVGIRILAALQRAAVIRITNSLAAVVTVALVAVCAAVHLPTWTYVVALAGPTTLTGLLQLVWAAWFEYPYLALDRRVFDLPEAVRTLRTGVQYAVLSLGWVLAYTLDAIVVSDVMGAARAAVFAVAARLFGLVGGTLTMAGQQMWPAISEALARGDVDWVRRRFRHSILAAFATSAAGSIVLLVAGRTFARVWVGGDLVPPLSLFVAFAAWTIYMTVMTQYSYLLFARERIRALAVLGLVIAAVNLGASIAFTEWFGLVGPILGNLVAAAAVQLVPTVVMNRRLARELGLLPRRVTTVRRPLPGPRPTAQGDPLPPAANAVHAEI